MKGLALLVASMAALLSGCDEFRERCPAEFVHRDEAEILTYLELSGVQSEQFCRSKAVRAQYDRWVAGEIMIDGNAVKARHAAEHAESSAALSLGLSIGAAGSR